MACRTIPVTGTCSSIPVPRGCPDSRCHLPEGLCPERGAGAAVALPHGTAAPTPTGTSLETFFSIFLLLHSWCPVPICPPVALPQGISGLR